jgi:hypothetical protein
MVGCRKPMSLPEIIAGSVIRSCHQVSAEKVSSHCFRADPSPSMRCSMTTGSRDHIDRDSALVSQKLPGKPVFHVFFDHISHNKLNQACNFHLTGGSCNAKGSDYVLQALPPPQLDGHTFLEQCWQRKPYLQTLSLAPNAPTVWWPPPRARMVLVWLHFQVHQNGKTVEVVGDRGVWLRITGQCQIWYVHRSRSAHKAGVMLWHGSRHGGAKTARKGVAAHCRKVWR